MNDTTSIFAIYKQPQHKVVALNISLLLLCFFPTLTFCEPQIEVQLAEVFEDTTNVKDFLVSEKYDGVRAIWKNGKLQTRNGNIIHAPNWFTKHLPNVWLDGELWSKRQDFEYVASTVSKHHPVDSEWKNIRYMVFDAPDTTHNFQQRAQYYTRLINDLNLTHVVPVEQFKVENNNELSSLLTKYTKAGAEGLMLHKADAMFSNGRNDNLLKLKPYMDAEAVVLKHLPGKGKYEGKMGSLIVRWYRTPEDVVEFKIGTGFNEEERASPPKVGSTITFKYHGLTRNKLPRFPSYLRTRKKPPSSKSSLSTN